MTVLSYLADYEAYKKGLGLKEATVRVALFLLKRFDQWLKAKRRRDVRQVGLCEIEAYLEGLESSDRAPAKVYGNALEIRSLLYINMVSIGTMMIPLRVHPDFPEYCS